MNTHDLERAMIEQLLAEKRWSRVALKAKLEDVDPVAFDAVFAALVCEGAAVADRTDVQASRCLRWLDEHGLLRDPTPPNGSPDAATMDRILARQPPRG